MTRLSFEYDESSGYPAKFRAEYRGLTVLAIQDESPSNPWQDQDGLAPLLWYSLGGDGIQDESGAYDLESVLGSTQYFSEYALGRKWRQLCQALGVDDPAALDAELKTERREYGGRLADYRRDKLESVLSDLKPDGWRQWGAACDYFAALESLWTLAGVPALDFQHNGYSQGDSVRGLLVATPAWIKAMGIPAGHDFESDLKAQADLFGAYAFGDVYGYVIESPEGEHLDSCWGFYGGDFDESGLAEAAQDSAESILASAAKRKAEKLKELIRNRVPLALRPALLAEAGELKEPVYMTAAQWQAADAGKESAVV
jgi:hypothetical protein